MSSIAKRHFFWVGLAELDESQLDIVGGFLLVIVTRAVHLSQRFSDLDLRPLSLLFFFFFSKKGSVPKTGLDNTGLLLNKQQNTINTMSRPSVLRNLSALLR